MSTKEKILTAAVNRFATQGIDKTSTAQITKDAGIASGTLFIHFKTKQELIDTLYITIKQQAMSNLGALVDPKDTPEKSFRAVIRYLIEYYIKHYHEFIFMELVENDPQVSQKALEEGQKSYTNITQITSDWIQKEYFKPLGLELLQRVTWSMCMVFIRYCKAKKLKKIPEEYLDIIWEAVKK